MAIEGKGSGLLKCMGIALMLALLSACSGGGSDGAVFQEPEPEGPMLPDPEDSDPPDPDPPDPDPENPGPEEPDPDPPEPDPVTLYTISGTVTASSGSAVDGDVNDLLAPYAANGACATAQLLPNPVTLGGYVNAPGAGAAGRSFVSGDLDDFYRVSLLAGQTVTLYISEDGSFNDLDLFLVDGACSTLVDASESLASVETVIAPIDGDYLINVYVYCGFFGNACGMTATNYNLVIGQAGATEHDGLNAADDFVPGEAVVIFGEAAGAMSEVQAQAKVQSIAPDPQAGTPGLPVLWRFGDGNERAIASGAGPAKRPGGAIPRLGAQVPPELQAKLETIASVRALRARTDVAAADLNYIRRALRVPGDQFYGFQWHYPQINLPAAWDVSLGDDVIVAVVDTGVLLDHPDLQGQLLAGYDFISSPGNALDGDGIDPDPDDPGDRNNPDGQSSFHGTHVAGTVAARSDNGIGVAGVAWNARIMPLRALGRFGGTSFDIQQAVLFAAGLPNASGTVPPRRADVVNLSLGGSGSSASEQGVYTQARAAGVVIVAAAGNSGSAVPSYPASYDGVISVSAVGIDKGLAPYSNFGPLIDVAAPGGDASRDLNGDGFIDGVLSLSADDGSGALQYLYRFQQGTSMAAPHVSGVIALMKAVNPSLTPDDIDDLLSSGAITEDLGASGRDNQFGWGLIDAFKAVQAAGAAVSPVPLLQASPESLNFTSGLASLTLRIRNAGGGSLAVDPPTADADWLSVIPGSVDGAGLGTYTVAVERAGLAVGTYHAVITIASDADTLQVSVIMQVAESGVSGGDAGFHWMLLVDPDTFEALRVVNAANAGGAYGYEFTDVPAGRYLVFTGTDLNNDMFICDRGEACGAYPTITLVEELTVDADVSNVDFVTSFDPGLSAAGASAPRPGLSRVPGTAKQLGQRP